MKLEGLKRSISSMSDDELDSLIRDVRERRGRVVVVPANTSIRYAVKRQSKKSILKKKLQDLGMSDANVARIMGEVSK